MDSLVTIAIALENYKVAVLHIQYGQRTEQRELKSFNNICRYYSVNESLVSRLSALGDIGGSSITDKSIPVTKANLESNEIPISYVPFRNAHFLSTAVSWAEVIGASAIFIGAVEEDSSGYPDCRREFYDAFEISVDIGTKPETKIEIITPLIFLNKSEIIKTGLGLNAPFELSWSCYQNSEKACGNCDSCVLRLRAFKNAGVQDPIPYEVIPEEYKI